MVYDREMGNMRMLLVSPFPRWFLLVSQAARQHRGLRPAGLCVSGHRLALGRRHRRRSAGSTVLPALVLSGFMLGALGHAAVLRDPAAGELRRGDELRHLPDVLRLVGALSAVAGAAVEPGWCTTICRVNPFTYAVELIRFALYAQVDPLALAVVAGATVLFTLAAILAYDPSRGLIARRGGG